MGWGDCGTDSTGRPIGYIWEAVCDHPGCETGIDRGLAFACGGMHGEGEGCEKYFCEQHRNPVYHLNDDGSEINLGDGEWFCETCEAAIIANYKEYGI